jgi:hypothetical protein
MRDRLTEVLKNSPHLNTLYDCEWDESANWLINKGVIAPTLKIDDTIYRCGADKVYEWQIAYIQVYADEIVYVDDSDNYIFESDIGKTVFLTKEEAEQALKGGGKE